MIKTLSVLKQIFLEMLPAEKDVESKSIIQDIREGDYDYGWNACLQEIKAKLNQKE